MVRQYTPAIRFANSGSSAGKSFQYVQTLEQTRQCVSDHDVQHDHFSGVVRYAREWRFHNVLYYLFNPVPAKANPAISIPTTPAYVSLTGSNFTPGCMVYLDDVLATPTGAEYVDPNHITFQAPAWPGEEQHVMVRVVRPDMRTGSNGNIFSYENVPVLTAIAPTSGYVEGGEALVVKGFYLKDGSVAAFVSGNIVLSSSQVAFFDSHLVTVETPPATVTGSYSVALISPSGLQSTPAPQLFTYVYHPPSILGVFPTQVSSEGNQTVTVDGLHFLSGAVIYVGGASQASSTSWINDGRMQFITSPHSSGTVDVYVRNPDGQVSNTSSLKFVVGLPAVTYISPTIGTSGTVLQVRGTKLSSSILSEQITNVKFISTSHLSSYNAPTFRFDSPVSGAVTMPSMLPGQYFLQVSSSVGAGSSEAALISVMYEGIPSIAAINPPAGGIAGNYYAYLTGTHFLTSSVVTVDGVPVTYAAIGAPSSSYIYARIIMPPHAAGNATVTITNYEMFSGSISFTYLVLDSVLSGSQWSPDTK